MNATSTSRIVAIERASSRNTSSPAAVDTAIAALRSVCSVRL